MPANVAWIILTFVCLLPGCRTTTGSSERAFVGEEGAACDPTRGIVCRNDLKCAPSENDERRCQLP